MKKIITSIVICFTLVLSTFVFSAPKKALVFKQIVNNQFFNQRINAAQEKVYLQTDKPYYSAGEEIWIKSYLVNATTLQPNTLSNYVYIELIDKQDSVYYRIKLKGDSLGFAGHIKLKPEIPTGLYTLRGYTWWMQNADTEFFFSKNIFIGNEINNRISSQISYGKAVDGLIPVTLTFTDASHNPVAGKKAEIVQNWASASKKKMVVETDKAGTINWKISIDAKDDSKKYFGVSMATEGYKTKIFLPELIPDFDVQFFPESGLLLDNSLQPIAFKAIDKNGLAVEVNGKVYNNKNEEICDFSSFHKGMGKFSLLTQPGENYSAVVKTTDGSEKRFELPKTKQNGVTLHLLNNRGKTLYDITNETNIPNRNLYLLLHSKGIPIVLQQLNILEGQITDSLLPAGIISFSVIDSLGNTYCERLSFSRNFELPTINMNSDKTTYKKREAVNLNFNVQSIFRKSVKGSFSISITDSHSVKQDSLGDNILTNLLLTSDIKGFVEEPAAYFADNSLMTREKTDLLMMTQGWRRFNTAEVIKSVYDLPKYEMEVGQILSGKVSSIYKVPVKKADIIMLSPYKNMLRTTKTDSLGRYLIDRIEFPDSTSIVLKAKKPKSITDVELLPDSDSFPVSNVNIPIPFKLNLSQEQNDYFQQSSQKYYYDGGMRVINLGEVTVKTDKKAQSQSEFYSGLADAGITSEQIEKYPHTNIYVLLSTIAGVQASEDHISIRGSRNNPLILVDDIEVLDLQDISYLNSDDVQSIEVFKGVNASIFGANGGDGVIAITLRKGVNLKIPTPISLAHITPLGYQKPAQFYVPKYDVDSMMRNPTPDLRTTIYWNPKLQTDTNGNIKVKFYTADKTNDYNVILEGVTAAGELCRFVGILKREDK